MVNLDRRTKGGRIRGSSESRMCRSILPQATKTPLDLVKEPSAWFPPLKSALGGVSTLVNYYEVLAELVAVAHD